jgi:hypothetical protein
VSEGEIVSLLGNNGDSAYVLVHHLRNTVTFGLWGKITDKERYNRRIDYRHQNNERPPRGWALLRCRLCSAV